MYRSCNNLHVSQSCFVFSEKLLKSRPQPPFEQRKWLGPGPKPGKDQQSHSSRLQKECASGQREEFKHFLFFTDQDSLIRSGRSAKLIVPYCGSLKIETLPVEVSSLSTSQLETCLWKFQIKPKLKQLLMSCRLSLLMSLSSCKL